VNKLYIMKLLLIFIIIILCLYLWGSYPTNEYFTSEVYFMKFPYMIKQKYYGYKNIPGYES